jgi:hypothetical protein
MAQRTLEHLVPPDDAAAHIHAGTDELDSADSGDLDRFSKVIFAKEDLVGGGPRIWWFSELEGKEDHSSIWLKGFVVLDQGFPDPVMKALCS